MILVGITLFLILIGLGFFAYGAIALSKYAFRMGTGPGLMTLLFPPYTIYFALFKLEEEGKSWPTASWLFGIVVSILLTVAFWPDLSALMSGDMERFEGPIGAGAAAVEKYGSQEEMLEEESSSDSADKKEEKADEGEAAAEEKADGEKAEGADSAEGESAEGAEKAEGEAAEGEAAGEKAGAEAGK
ncbi:hypothetical protein FIV42_04555 [Persicimonas caeni]|uniref:Uncharacterized protein n=1 Tax=Persicimonas caeni TaxID=2292766 RepID=A0A4Y6PNZ8_PERCE|nr:hypothetical protein [Persicimonas caeni]QDG50034.1 hypothetical protein FIV42_04555 [Persicimonas caeni]QED31255.1 hypothetical protein FRD00_04550 [Persicimonas caeni]